MEVIGFGLAGACVALRLQERGISVRVRDDGRIGSTVVAAGLVNPVAGRNFEPSAGVREAWAVALKFYQGLDASLWHPLAIKRLWLDEKDRAKFVRKRSAVESWIENVTDEGVTWKEGGWLETKRFLGVAREHFLEKGGAFSSEEGECDERIWCCGSAGLMRGDFAGVPHRCAKGEILTVRIPGFQQEEILTGGGWLIPLGDDRYRVGATYEWDGLESGPTAGGRERVEKMLRGFSDLPFEVLEHVAGVRPIIHRSEPSVRFEEGRGWMLNGLGSKGVIYAPQVARHLVEKVICESGREG